MSPEEEIKKLKAENERLRTHYNEAWKDRNKAWEDLRAAKAPAAPTDEELERIAEGYTRTIIDCNFEQGEKFHTNRNILECAIKYSLIEVQKKALKRAGSGGL